MFSLRIPAKHISEMNILIILPVFCKNNLTLKKATEKFVKRVK